MKSVNDKYFKLRLRYISEIIMSLTVYKIAVARYTQTPCVLFISMHVLISFTYLHTCIIEDKDATVLRVETEKCQFLIC